VTVSSYDGNPCVKVSRRSATTIASTIHRLEHLKDVIENKGGYRIFYYDGKPLRRETDLQILYKYWITFGPDFCI
jgi:hypothetical protein